MGKFTKAITAIRFVGFGIALKTIHYSLYRDRIEKKAQDILPMSDWQKAPGTFTDVKSTINGLEIQFGPRILEINVLLPDLFRISWLPGEVPLPHSIHTQEWASVNWDFSVGEKSISLITEYTRINVSMDGSIEFLDSQGRIIRGEEPPQFFEKGWSHLGLLHPHECIYGMGLKAAPLNLRGHKFKVWNTDPGGSYNPGEDPLYLNSPVYIGLHEAGSYLVFYENSYLSTFEFTDSANANFSGGMLRYYLSIGSIPQLLDVFTRLTGRPPLPPLWSLGYHQSRWGYKTEAEIRATIQSFATHRLPLDAIHLDIDYMDGYRVFTVDQDRFPDLKTLTEDLAKQDIKVVTILDPGVKMDPSYPVYQEGKDLEMFITTPDGSPVQGLVWPGWCAFPDFSSTRVRDWWAEKYRLLLEKGVAGIWHDMNEPAVFSAWGDVTLPQNSCHVNDGVGGYHLANHNVYGFLMNMAGYDALRAIHPDRRPWILSRSGWVGSQRFAWNWTADVNSTWEMLQQMIPMMLNLTLSGFYYSGSDIGGFSGHPSKELYIRWFQMAAFSPFFRLHNALGLPAREPYRFDGETCDIVRQILLTRKNLLPYLYTLAYHATQLGEPLLRPMVWENASESDYWEIQDQFMLGPALLVAPVLYPDMYTRSVSLPSVGYFDYWSEEYYSKPGRIDIEAPLDKIPVFVKAGAIIPLQQGNRILLKVFLPDAIQNGISFSSQLYSDAGDGYGEFRYEQYSVVRDNGELTLRRKQTGKFPWPHDGILMKFIGGNVNSILVDGNSVQQQNQLFSIEAPFNKITITGI